MWRILLKSTTLGMIFAIVDPAFRIIPITCRIISSHAEQIILYTDYFLFHLNVMLEEDYIPLATLKERQEEAYLMRVQEQDHLGAKRMIASASDVESSQKEEKDLQILVKTAENAEKGLRLYACAVWHWLAFLLAVSMIFSLTLMGIFKRARPRFYIGPIFVVLVFTYRYLIINSDRPKDFIDYTENPNDGKEEWVWKRTEVLLPCNVESIFDNVYNPWFMIHFILWIYLVFEALFEWIYLRMVQQPTEDMDKLRIKSKNVLDLEKLFDYCTQGDKVLKIRDVIRKYGQSIDINATRNGSTLLHVAVKGGHKDILEILVKGYKGAQHKPTRRHAAERIRQSLLNCNT